MKHNTLKIIILFMLFILPLDGNSQSTISLYNFTFEDTTNEYYI
jgi:hypothetical protein